MSNNLKKISHLLSAALRMLFSPCTNTVLIIGKQVNKRQGIVTHASVVAEDQERNIYDVLGHSRDA